MEEHQIILEVVEFLIIYLGQAINNDIYSNNIINSNNNNNTITQSIHKSN